jgi:hypothetical protein
MSYPKEIIFDALEILETICPKSILIIGESLHSITDDYQQQCEIIHSPCKVTLIHSSAELTDPAYANRYDIAIVGEIIEKKERTKAEHVFGRLRDLCTPKIIVLADLNGSSWSTNELFGFGFVKHATYSHQNPQIKEISQLSLFHYNIDSYKKTPEWFNPKNWANPELWNKFWW